MFGSKAEEMYYKTMPAHAPYTFEEMTARGEFSARPTHRRSIDKAGSPGKTTLSEWEARRKIIDETGWNATNHTAYRPLGTPDLDRRRSALPGRLQLEEHTPNAGETAAAASSVKEGAVEGAKGPRRHEDRTLASAGLAQLRAEMEASRDRARFCRTGSSFMSLLHRQQRGQLPTGAAIGDARNGAWRRDRGSHRLPRVVDDAEPAQLSPRMSQATSPLSPVPGRLSPPPEGAASPGITSPGSGPSMLSPEASDVASPVTSSPTFLALDPAVTVKARSQEFMASAESMDGRLMEAVGQMRDERVDQYRRKYVSLRVEGAPGMVEPRAFNAEEWRLEAEKRRIEARLRALERHRWYGRLLKLVPAGTASLGMGIGMGVGGRGASIIGAGMPGGWGESGSPGAGSRGGPGRRPTRAEVNVVAAVRDVVENGHEFDRERFFQLLLMLPRDDHVHGQRLLTFIQLELGISAEEYKHFSTATGVPLPTAVEMMYLQKKGATAGTPGASDPVQKRR